VKRPKWTRKSPKIERCAARAGGDFLIEARAVRHSLASGFATVFDRAMPQIRFGHRAYTRSAWLSLAVGSIALACGSTSDAPGAASAGGAAVGGAVASGGQPSLHGGNGGSDATGPNAGGSSSGQASFGGSAGAGGAAGGAPLLQRPRRTADEVLLVSNSQSAISQAIAADYAQKRAIKNTLSITCADSAQNSDQETIAFADYTKAIATPIRAYLAAHPQIDFVVLTKGIPIRIAGADTGCCENDDDGKNKPSVDSYLAAIDYPERADAVKIGITGSGTVGHGYLNRYWNANEAFSHAKFGGYLVTRLDGLTEADALSLVTRALSAERTQPAHDVLLDVQPGFGLADKTIEPDAVTSTVTDEWSYGKWNADLLHAHDLLTASDITTELDLTDQFIGGRADLTGYFSWGSNDGSSFSDEKYGSLAFAPGSLADTAVSTSARTFLPTSGGQSLLTVLIAHGLTAGKGYVGEPLLQGIASPTIALDRYYSGYSMAESLYAASRFTGWEDIVVGDPLCTPYAAGPGIVTPVLASQFDEASAGPRNEDCTEGGQDVGNLSDGAYTAYKALPLSGATHFEARVASPNAGGSIEIHLDSVSGTLLGTCAVPTTGDYQAWSTAHCNVSQTTGSHDVYLVYKDGGAGLFNIEWFAFRSHQ